MTSRSCQCVYPGMPRAMPGDMKQTPLAAPAPASVAARLPCPTCDGVGHVDASHPDAGYHPDAFIAVERTRFGKVSYRAVPCDRCQGEGTIPCCEHGHECGVDEVGYCEACWELFEKWIPSESDVIDVAATCDHPDCDELVGHDGPHTWPCDDGSCCEPSATTEEEVAYVRERHFGGAL